MTPLLAAMLAALTLNPHAQTPTQPPTAPAPTGVIRGHVLSADGRPLRDANVSLLPSGGGFVRTAHTDEDGSYQFSDLPAGGYRVTASHSGFSSLSFGQRSASDWGAPFVLRAGEVREHVDIVLPRHSAIVGHVTDENGDPLEGVNVSVLKIGFTAGRRQLVPSGAPSQRTNDQGRFRVYGLQPGAYVIGADTGQVGREVLPGYATTYFPGTPNASEAQTVAVGLSQDVMDVNFSLVPVRTVRVSGRTVASDGEPFQGGVEMRVSRRSSAVASGSFGARTESDGSFEFPNVPPGEYVIGAFKSQEVGWQIVAVSDADVTGLVVPTSPGSTVTGRVTFDGANPPERSSVNVAFVPADPDFVPFKVRRRKST